MRSLPLLLAFLASSVDTSDVGVDVVSVDATAPTCPFEHYWKKAFGSGHAKLTLREDWQEHAAQAVQELGMQGVRYHGIFDDDMTVVVPTENHSNRSCSYTFNFSLIDQSWDFQIEQGLVPTVELSFMPALFANCSWGSLNPGAPACKTMMAYRGIDQPPTAFQDWQSLVSELAKHAIARYGLAEVRKWRWEVWNELWGMAFPEPYMSLFAASARALKAIDTQLQVGGPATAQISKSSPPDPYSPYVPPCMSMGCVVDFVQQCQNRSIPFDFVSSHFYPSHTPCGHGKNWDPECFHTALTKSRQAIQEVTDRPFYLTEYNVGCCDGYSQHDTSAAAAFIFRVIPELHNVTELLSYWTFSDVFEEGGLPRSDFQNTYGLMTFHGVPKPGWRAFQLLHAHAGTARVATKVTQAKIQTEATGNRRSGQIEGQTEGQTEDPVTCRAFPASGMTNGGDVERPTKQPNASACISRCEDMAGRCCLGLWNSANCMCYLKDEGSVLVGRGKGATAFNCSGCGSGPTPAPAPTPATVPLIAAFATTAATSSRGDDAHNGDAPITLSDLRVFISYWANPSPAAGQVYGNRSISVQVRVDTQLMDSAEPVDVTVHQIDDAHANPRSTFEAMGSPLVSSITPQQIAKLKGASTVVPYSTKATVANATGGASVVEVTLRSIPSNCALVLQFQE